MPRWNVMVFRDLGIIRNQQVTRTAAPEILQGIVDKIVGQVNQAVASQPQVNIRQRIPGDIQLHETCRFVLVFVCV